MNVSLLMIFRIHNISNEHAHFRPQSIRNIALYNF